MLRRLKLLLLGILDCVSRVGRAVDALAVARAVVRRLLAAPDLEALAHDAAHDARPRARAVIHDRPARLLLQPLVASILVLDGQGELRPSLRRQILASATLLMRELLRFLPGVPEIILLPAKSFRTSLQRMRRILRSSSHVSSGSFSTDFFFLALAFFILDTADLGVCAAAAATPRPGALILGARETNESAIYKRQKINLRDRPAPAARWVRFSAPRFGACG